MKRITSALLVLCLVCSLMPIMGVSAADEGTLSEKSGITVVYDWAEQMNGKGDNVQINNDAAFLSQFTFTRSHNLWEFEAAQNSWAATSWRMYGGKCIQFNRSGGNLWMAFEIYVPKTGWYTIEQNYAKISGSESDVAVYMMAKNGDFAIGNRNDENKVFTLDCKGESSSITAAEPATANKYIEAGYYYVLYLQVGGGSAYFGNLTLNGGTGRAVTEIASVSAPTEVNVGDTGSVVTEVYYSDTTEGTAVAGDVVYTSSNANVLSVDEATGAYTAKAGGNATITATAGAVSKSVEITVKKPEQSGITVVYDWAEQMNGKGNNVQINTDAAFLSQFTFTRSHNLWEFEAAQNSWAATSWREHGGKCIQFNRNKGSLWMAFEIYVPKTGTYTLKQNYAKFGGSVGEIAVHMIPKEGETAYASSMKNDDNKVFTLDCKGASGTNIVAAEPMTLDKPLEKGYYYVVYQQNASTSTDTNVALFGNLTLNGGTDEVDKTEIVKYTAPTVDGLDITGTLIEPEYNEETNTFTLTADAEKNGNKFLYWAKGMSDNKKIISFSNKLENYKPEEDGRNYLIAVYEGDVPAKAEYYNANGQLIATETEPAKPSMAGYGKAYDWEQYGETGIYVAKYAIEEPQENIKVDVVGGEGSGIYAYGDTVTCTATPSADQTFKCWTKTLDNDKTEIVSVDASYTFSAWEACTVTAVYEYTYSGSAMKIVIDSFSVTNGVTGIMAEFIGLGNNVVEKGIMFGDNRIAMTKPGKQFTVIADKNGTYKGYAIIKDGANHKLIVDGEVTISDVE